MAKRRLKKNVKILLGVVAGITVIAAIGLSRKEQIKELLHVESTRSDEYVSGEHKNLSEWRNINPDVRWLLKFAASDGMHDIPVAVTDDGDYYMTHNLYREYDTMGAVFMDLSEGDPDSSENWMIYGHSSKYNDWCFTFLKRYADQSYMDNYPSFVLEDETGDMVYKIVSFARYDLENEETYLGWYQNNYGSVDAVLTMFRDSTPHILTQTGGLTYTGQQLVTLITCDMDEENTRYVMTAIQVPSI